MVMPGAPSPAPATHQAYYLDALENVLKGPGYDASLAGRVRQALHGEGLPAARLAVGKDGAIVALSDALRGGTQPGAQLAQHGRAQGYLLTQGPAPPAPLPSSPTMVAPGGVGRAEMEAAPLVGWETVLVSG